MTKLTSFRAKVAEANELVQRTKKTYKKTQGLASNDPLIGPSIVASTPLTFGEAFTGQNGLYANCAIEGGLTQLVDRIQQYFSEYEIEINDNLHSTVMYCRESELEMDEAINAVEEAKLIDNKSGYVTGIELIDGHDNGNYLIVNLKSDYLEAVHELLKKKGYEHSFPDFLAHITITDPAPFTADEAQLNMNQFTESLKNSPLEITYSEPILNDCKKPK